MAKLIKMVTVFERSEESKMVEKSVINALSEAKVAPDCVIAILGETVIGLLASYAKLCGLDAQETIKDFGKGIASAEIEFK